MCERYSWIEKDKAVLFLTAEQVYHTRRGKKTQRDCNNDPSEYYGHGAIRFYYDHKGGVNKECEDFTSSDNFPPELVEAIKAGEMREFGVTNEMYSMLTEPAYDKYEKIRDTAFAEYEKICGVAYAEYEKIDQLAYDKYEKIRNAAYAEYVKSKDAAYAECAAYEKIRSAAYDKHMKSKDAAFAKYMKIDRLAFAEYRKVRDDTFWDLFKNPKNRIECWR